MFSESIWLPNPITCTSHTSTWSQSHSDLHNEQINVLITWVFFFVGVLVCVFSVIYVFCKALATNWIITEVLINVNIASCIVFQRFDWWKLDDDWVFVSIMTHTGKTRPHCNTHKHFVLICSTFLKRPL